METWFWILDWSFFIATTAGNGFIIFLICRRWRLRTKNQRFCRFTRCGRFLCWAECFSPLLNCEKTTGCDHEAPFADRVDYLRWLFTYASVTNLSSLVQDPYIAIVKPLKYFLFMTCKRVSQMIFISWALLAFDVLMSFVFNDNLSLFLISFRITMIFFEFLPCCGLISWSGSMLDICQLQPPVGKKLVLFGQNWCTIRAKTR